MMNTSRYVFLLPLLILLAGCGPTAQSEPRTTDPKATNNQSPLTRVNWNQFTYTINCYGATHTFHARAGQAVDKGIHFAIYPEETVYGDLTGDGVQEAAVSYSCTGADFGGAKIVVFTGDSNHPSLLGELPSESPRKDTNTLKDAESVTIQNKQITLSGPGYSPKAAHCCPDLYLALIYKWNGYQFELAESHATKK